VDLIGTRIGSYVVERELGAGGAGTVYACRHTLIEREVAVKVLHDEHVRDPDQIARFFQEAKAAAEIGHPNIIVIIDYGTLDLAGVARTYVMMESLDGQSLDKRMRRGGLSSDDILHIFSQSASALVACHGKGIIHRDLKPSNVFLCNRSFDPLFVKVLDFGTAKLTAPAPDMRRTQYGIVIGTPAYMSPEQCEGKGAIDHRSDIYSLGVMLYEMLTGTLPFEGAVGDILLAHMTRAPDPPRQRNPSIPPEWEALCLRMMEKSREARFQSVTQLAHALEDLRGHAAAYEAARVQRIETGHSGHTLVSGASNDLRQTLRVDVGEVVPSEPEPIPQSENISYASFNPRSGCTTLVEDPRHAAFARTLMSRPPARWFEVAEVCQTANVAQPATLPMEIGLFVAWLEHPYPDPSLAAVVFLSLRTGWSAVVLCARAR